MVFPFQFVNMMYHIDLLPYIEESLHPWDVLSCSVISNSLWPHRLYPPDSSVHGDSPGKITGMDLPGDLPNSGIEPASPTLQEPPGKPWSFQSIVGFCLLEFCWGFLHLSALMILAYNFLYYCVCVCVCVCVWHLFLVLVSVIVAL